MREKNLYSKDAQTVGLGLKLLTNSVLPVGVL